MKELKSSNIITVCTNRCIFMYTKRIVDHTSQIQQRGKNEKINLFYCDGFSSFRLCLYRERTQEKC